MKPALYLLPGLLCDETVWRGQVDHLFATADVRVPHYGNADTITEMARHVLADTPERFSIAGHSMGARVALEVFRLAPEKIERFCMLDTGIHSVKPDEQEKRMRLVAIAREQGMDALCDAWLPPMMHPDFRNDETFLAPLRQMVMGFSAERFAGQIRALLARPETGTVIASIKCPVLIGVGRDDQWSPIDQHQDIQVQLGGRGRLVIFENAGHMAPYEAPESVNSALAEWFSTPA